MGGAVYAWLVSFYVLYSITLCQYIYCNCVCICIVITYIHTYVQVHILEEHS